MKRAAIAVVALALGVAALPVTGASNAIANEPTCRDVNAGVAVPDPGEDCFPGSTARRAVVVGLLAVSAAVAVLAMLIGAVAVIRGRGLVLFSIVALSAIGVFFAAYGAARF